MISIGRTRGISALIITSAGIALISSGCGDPGPKFGPPATLTRTGDLQTAVVATAVPVAPAVAVKDADGRGVPNVVVTFAVVGGGGSVIGATATTDRNGIATVTSWVLGTAAGFNSLKASVPGLPSTTFSATGTAGPADKLTKLSIDPTCASHGANIDSIAVQVTDQFGNVVSGQTVTFAVSAGGGSVSPSTRITQADGRAAARWTLGSGTGVVNSATATLSGIATPTTTFTTTTVEPTASVAMSSRVFAVDSSRVINPTAVARDQSGAIVTCASVAMTTRQSIVATASGAAVTGQHTGQTFLIASSIEDPSIRDSAIVVVGNVGAPVVMAIAPRFDLKADTTFTVPIVVDMRSSPEKLGAATVQVSWDPSVLTYVTDSDGSSAAGATVNSGRASIGVLTLAMASSDGFSGAVEVRTVTFRASAVAGRTGALTVTTIDLSGATNFTSLASKTVSTSYPLRTR